MMPPKHQQPLEWKQRLLLEMQFMPTLAILGSGLTGLTAAHAITTNPHAKGLTVLLIDKGHYPGGRMASYTENGYWDTGAQYAKPSDTAFKNWVESKVGPVIAWPDDDRFAVPQGFRRLGEQAAMGLNMAQRTTISQIRWDHASQRWQLLGQHYTAGPKSWWADGLLLTCPVPQACALIHAYLPTDHDLHQVTYAPNITLQLQTSQALHQPYRSTEGCIGWVADNAVKWPNSAATTHYWTVQSTPAFAEKHWDLDDATLTQMMLKALVEQLGLSEPTWTVSRLKRWRYAFVTQAYSLPYYAHPQLPLWLAGDGFVGPRLEAAWQSGQAVAKSMLATYLDPSRH
jgi:renalase